MFEQIARIEAMIRTHTPRVLDALDDLVITWQRIALAAERIADAIAPAHPSEGGVIEAKPARAENDERAH